MTSRQTQLYGSLIFDASDVTAMKRKIGKYHTLQQYALDKGYSPSTLGTIVGQRFKLDVVEASKYCGSDTCPLNVPADTKDIFVNALDSLIGSNSYLKTSMRPAEGVQ